MKELKNLIIVLAEAIIGILAIIAIRAFVAWITIPIWALWGVLIIATSVVIGWNWPQMW